MNLRRITTLLLALLLSSTSGCFLLGPGPGFIEPDVHLTNLYFRNATLFETSLVCSVRIENGNPDTLNLDGGTVKLYINENYVGKGFLKEEVSVPKYSSSETDVEIALSNLTMLSQIVPMVEAPEFSYRIDSNLSLGSPYSGSSVSTSTKSEFRYPGRN